MDKNKINFELNFAKKIVKLQVFQWRNIHPVIPDEVIATLIEKKDLLWEKLQQYDEIPDFTPIIPNHYMELVKQINYFLLVHSNEHEIHNIWFGGFFGNAHLACDFSKIGEPGFLIDTKCIDLSSLVVTAKHNDIGNSIREEISKLGYIPANHVEAFSMAYFSEILKESDEELCAVNFGWDGFEFASIHKRTDSVLGFKWHILLNCYDENGKYKDQEKKILIPVFKESV